MRRSFQVVIIVTEQANLIGRGLGLLGALQGKIDRPQQHGAVHLKHIEGPRPNQGLHRASVNLALVDTTGKVEQVAKRPLGPGSDNGFDGALPRTLDRSQPITNFARRLPGRSNRGKAVTRLVDVGWQQAQTTDFECVFDQDLDFVGVVHRQRQVGRHEGRWMVGFQIGGVVGQQSVGSGVGLVEAIAGKFFHQVENFIGLFLGQAVFASACPEQQPVLGHFLGLFLAHGASQQIRATQGITANDLGHLHHLLLIHHDAVGLGQDGFGARIGKLESFAMLASAEIGNQVHRPRAIQGHQSDDVLEAVGPRILKHALHAAAFQLEDCNCFSLGQQIVGCAVVQRQVVQHKVCLARIQLLDIAYRQIQDGQRGQPEKVELDQTHGLDVVLVVL